MLRFSLFGIPVAVQPWFWVTLAIIGGAIGAHNAETILRVFLFVLAGFFSILVHELGHALSGKAFGAATRITLHAFGGLASFTGTRFTRGQDFMVTAAGPAIQLALGAVFWVLLNFLPGIPPRIELFMAFVILVSFFWAVINLVPVIPLDGGQMMANLVGPGRRSTALKISIASAIVAGILLYPHTGFIFPIFLGLMAWQNWQELQYRQR